MTETLNVQHLSKDLGSRAIVLLLKGSALTSYRNIVHPDKQYATRLFVTWNRIMHTFPSCFITEDLILNEHCAITSAHIKKRETEIYFGEQLQYMDHHCQIVFYNAKLVNYFK